MRPKRPEADDQADLFGARLRARVARRHALVRLAGLIDWGRLEAAFGPLYRVRFQQTRCPRFAAAMGAKPPGP